MITREYTTPHNGLKTTVWEQQVDGVPVFQGIMMGHVTKDGELVNLSSRFIANPTKAADKGTPARVALLKSPPISARRAIVEAAKNGWRDAKRRSGAPFRCCAFGPAPTSALQGRPGTEWRYGHSTLLAADEWRRDASLLASDPDQPQPR